MTDGDESLEAQKKIPSDKVSMEFFSLFFSLFTKHKDCFHKECCCCSKVHLGERDIFTFSNGSSAEKIENDSLILFFLKIAAGLQKEMSH